MRQEEAPPRGVVSDLSWSKMLRFPAGVKQAGRILSTAILFVVALGSITCRDREPAKVNRHSPAPGC